MAAPKSLAAKRENMMARMLNGKEVKAVLYNGKGVGHGKFMAGEVNGVLVTGDNGIPLPLRDIGQIVHI